MEAQDDEALARELHRELNVGPRRRQRRPPPPPRKREAQGKRERPDAESTEDGSTTEDSDDFTTRVPQKSSPGVSQQRATEPTAGGVCETKPAEQQRPLPPPAALERSATAPEPVQQRHEPAPTGDPADPSIRPKMKAATPGTPLTKSKSVQPTSARKHPSSGQLSSPPTKKHKPTVQTPTKVRPIVKDPGQQAATLKEPVVPKQPTIPRPPATVPPQPAAVARPTAAPQAPPKLPVAAGAAFKTPKKQAAPTATPEKATEALPLVFKGPGIVQHPQTSSTKAPAPKEANNAGPAPVLQIAPLHLKRDLLVPGAEQHAVGEQPPRPPPPPAARAAPKQVQTASRAQQAPAAAKLPPPPPPPVKREVNGPQPATGHLPAAPPQPQPPTAAPHPSVRLSPGRAPKRAESPAKVEKPLAKVDKPVVKAEKPVVKAEKPASTETSPVKADPTPKKAERSAAKADKSPPKPAKSPAKLERRANVTSEAGGQSVARPAGGLPPHPPRAAARSPQATSQQTAAMVGGQAPEGLDPLESSSRQVAYDWMHHHPTEYDRNTFLCQLAGADVSVWLARADARTRASFCAALEACPLDAATRSHCQEASIAMCDMRERKYIFFPPGAVQSNGDEHTGHVSTWGDAVEKATHVLLGPC